MRTPVPPSRRPSRPGLVAALVMLGALLALVLPAQTARAANYQYWGYYQVVNGAWTFSQVGPDQSAPADGAIEGWRYAVDDGTGASPRTPRALPTFSAVCDTTAAQSGKKRVAVVVDFGRPADGGESVTPPQPVARCASVATAATGAEVLGAVAAVRTAGGLVCGLDGYPATGCGGEVATLTDAQKATDTPVTIAPAAVATATASTTGATPATAVSAPATPPSNSPVGLWVGVVVLVLGLVALAWSIRRRRQHAA